MPIFSLIESPNHAMAAACVPDSGTWSFFDPNVGEAVLPTQSHFKTFVTGFFGASEVFEAYRRHEVAKVGTEELQKQQLEETKKLFLVAVRFRPTITTHSASST